MPIFDKASPESMQGYAPTVGSVFSLIGSHWMMHAGQWQFYDANWGGHPCSKLVHTDRAEIAVTTL